MYIYIYIYVYVYIGVMANTKHAEYNVSSVKTWGGNESQKERNRSRWKDTLQQDALQHVRKFVTQHSVPVRTIHVTHITESRHSVPRNVPQRVRD